MIFHRCKTLIFQTFKNPLNLQKTNDSVRLFVLSYSSSNNRTEEISNLLQKHNFSPINASKVASSLSRSKNAQKCDSILTFLKDSGFSASQLEKIMSRRPELLTSNLDRNIKPKIQFFQDLGFSISDIAVIFSARPEIFARSLTNGIVPCLTTLNSVFESVDQVSEVLKRYAHLLSYDLKKTMLPNIDYLKSCGVETDHIVRFAHIPRFLVLRPEKMKQYVEKAEELGCSRHSKMFLCGVRIVSSMSDESLKQKLNLFRELGFSQEQISLAFEKQPLVFSVSYRKICKAVKVILDNKIYDISNVIRSPLVFVCSVEKTIEPRLRVLDILLRRNLLKKPPPFYVTHSISKQRFFDIFIAPYLGEVDDFRSLDDWKELCKVDRVCS